MYNEPERFNDYQLSTKLIVSCEIAFLCEYGPNLLNMNFLRVYNDIIYVATKNYKMATNGVTEKLDFVISFFFTKSGWKVQIYEFR